MSASTASARTDGCPVSDTALALDNAMQLPPINPLEVRLDLLRGDVAVELSRLDLLLSVVVIYLEGGLDDELFGAMESATARFRLALAAIKKLKEQRQDAALNAEAAVEWRADRDRRRA